MAHSFYEFQPAEKTRRAEAVLCYVRPDESYSLSKAGGAMDLETFDERNPRWDNSRATKSTGGGGRVPPHNLEAEMYVLGGILLDNRALDSVYEIGIEPEDFYKEAHAKIYEAVLELQRRTTPAD